LKEIKGIQKVMDWLSKRDGFLYIYGACGCGKTHLSCAIKRRANELRLSCSLFFSSDIFLRIRKSFDNGSETESSIIDLCAPEYEKEGGENFAIFDDFGNQKITDYAIETWYNIINRRYMNGYPTIFTSNLSLKEISVSMTDRIASRLASGIIFEMKGNDRRLIKRDLTKVF
jgi:DNA replication protein DnaC